MNKSSFGRWTRDGVLYFKWNIFDSFDKLVLNQNVKDRVQRKLEIFSQGQQEFHSLQLPWKYGFFFFGPSGSGKTSIGKGIANFLNWSHFTIPAHEILDSHLLERALNDAITESERVIVLEDVDLMVRVMEPEVFFTLLDHAMARGEGVIWVASTRHPEVAPKTQLLRPGRFDEAIRLEIPGKELRERFLRDFFSFLNLEIDDAILGEWVSQTEGMSYSHFEELRHKLAVSKLEQLGSDIVLNVMKTYVEDQLIAGDRWGGKSSSTEKVEERVQQVDPRILKAALDMTDVIRVLMEKVIGDAAEQSKVGPEVSIQA